MAARRAREVRRSRPDRFVGDIPVERCAVPVFTAAWSLPRPSTTLGRQAARACCSPRSRRAYRYAQRDVLPVAGGYAPRLVEDREPALLEFKQAPAVEEKDELIAVETPKAARNAWAISATEARVSAALILEASASTRTAHHPAQSSTMMLQTTGRTPACRRLRGKACTCFFFLAPVPAVDDGGNTPRGAPTTPRRSTLGEDAGTNATAMASP